MNRLGDPPRNVNEINNAILIALLDGGSSSMGDVDDDDVMLGMRWETIYWN